MKHSEFLAACCLGFIVGMAVDDALPRRSREPVIVRDADGVDVSPSPYPPVEIPGPEEEEGEDEAVAQETVL